MSQFKVQHVIISLDDKAKPRLMSLHIPIDGKMRVHTLQPSSEMYNEIIKKLYNSSESITVEAEYIQLECPTYYAIIEPITK
jgi:hypothetical protein